MHVKLPARKAGYIVGGDHHTDGSGQAAANGFARRLMTPKCPIRVAVPERPEGAKEGYDWNDALVAAGGDRATCD